MRAEFERNTCSGIFNYIHEWDKSIEDHDTVKATPVESEKANSEIYAREIPEDRGSTRRWPHDSVPWTRL